MNQRPWYTPLFSVSLAAKLALPIAALTFGGTAQAQHPAAATGTSASVEQSGADNVALIEQRNVVPETYAHIQQDGDANNASVLQVGPGSVDDELGYLVTANAYQNGSANSVRIEQLNGLTVSAETHQTGTLNTATIAQDRERAHTTVSQAGMSNTALVDQPGYFWDTYADIEQSGARNSVYILQDGTNYGSVTSKQSGADNVADIHQTDASDYGQFQTVSLDTTGDGNNTQIYQNNGDGRIALLQTGDFNIVDINQSGESGKIDINNLNSSYNTDIVQQGGGTIAVYRSDANNNRVSLQQFYCSDEISVVQESSDSNTVEISQTGTFDNIASVIQRHTFDSSASIMQQEGVENTSNITQENVSGSYAATNTSGTYLAASIFQSGGADLSSAEIMQQGEQNTAAIYQTAATDSDADILQSGINGYAEIHQANGAFNTAAIDQAGNGYSATIVQSGSDNVSVILQM
jgi:hypothetical protein